MPPLDAPTRDYGALAARIRAAARPPLRLRVIGQQPAPPGAERYDLYLVEVPAGRRGTGRPPWRVYLNGGTHGDEPAGAEAVTRFLEEGRHRAWPGVAFTVTPCLNPWGFAHDRRAGPGGRDLNRAFRRAARATPEVGAVKRALRGRAFDLVLDCHEDVDAPGLYVFAPAALGRAIVAGVRPLGPVHPGPAVDGELPLKDSVVQLDAAGAFPPERRPAPTAWPLPLYVGRYHRRAVPVGTRAAGAGGRLAPPEGWALASATIETPTALPLEQRVAMHLAAVDAALRHLRGGRPVAGPTADRPMHPPLRAPPASGMERPVALPTPGRARPPGPASPAPAPDR